MEAFLAVATFGSFRRAAESLNLTQPAVSARIKGLETSLAVRLFERGRGSLTLSRAGRQFRPHAEQILQAAALARLAVQDHSGKSATALHLAAVPPLCTYLLPQALKRFRVLHRRVMITVRSGHPRELLEMVLRGDAEIGIARSLHHPDVETISLGEDPLILVGPFGSPMTPTRPVRLADIADQPFIFFDRDSSDWALSHELFSRVGLTPNIALEVETIELAARMVEYGMGLALLPRLSVADELRRRRLLTVRVIGTDLPRGSLDILHRRRRPLTPVALAFVGVLRATYARIAGSADARDDARGRQAGASAPARAAADGLRPRRTGGAPGGLPSRTPRARPVRSPRPA